MGTPEKKRRRAVSKIKVITKEEREKLEEILEQEEREDEEEQEKHENGCMELTANSNPFSNGIGGSLDDILTHLGIGNSNRDHLAKEEEAPKEELVCPSSASIVASPPPDEAEDRSGIVP